MTTAESETTIGYSVFDTFEECYQYNEDACFIADSVKNAESFLSGCFVNPKNCRIDAITFDDMMADFGSSFGEFAMEAEAFARFKAIAGRNGVQFTAEPYDGDDTLLVVEIAGVAILDDD